MQNMDKNSLNLEEFGERLRYARERKGLSQEALAHLLNKDQRAVSEYEMGKRRIYAVDIPVLAQALDMPILYFFGEDLNIHDLDGELLKHFHQLPTPKTKAVAVEYIRLLTETLQEFSSS